MTLIPVPNQSNRVDLSQLLADIRAQPPLSTLTCLGLGPCQGLPVPSILVGGPGQALLLHLHRNLTGVKVLTPLDRPQPNHPEWPGLHLKAVLAHSANPQHWIAFINVQGVWWRADSAVGTIRQEDPFISQIDPTRGTQGFTIDVALFLS